MKNKFRNLVLAFLCLGIFVGGGVLFYSSWVIQKPFGVILFLVPNLNTATLTAARVYSGGAESRLNFEKISDVALLRNSSADFVAGDPSAVASAMATGKKSLNGQLSMGEQGERSPTLLEIARERGRAVGVVTAGKITAPTLAAFYAPGCDGNNFEQVSLSLIEKRPDLVFGGGANGLIPEVKGGNRKDGKDLMLLARQSGYDIVRTRSEMLNTPTWKFPQVFGIFAPEEMAFSGSFEGKSGEPDFVAMVKSAIELLQYQRKGYFLVVDCSGLSKAAAQNAGEKLLKELVQVDQAVASAIDFAGENSMVIVAGTLSLGGCQLNGIGAKGDSGLAALGQSSQGVPALTWATGPGNPASADATLEPVAFSMPAPVPVATDSLGFFYGGKNSVFPKGFQDNTAVFQVIEAGL